MFLSRSDDFGKILGLFRMVQYERLGIWVNLVKYMIPRYQAVALLQLAGFTSNNGDLVLSSGAALAPLREVGSEDGAAFGWFFYSQEPKVVVLRCRCNYIQIVIFPLSSSRCWFISCWICNFFSQIWMNCDHWPTKIYWCLHWFQSNSRHIAIFLRCHRCILKILGNQTDLSTLNMTNLVVPFTPWYQLSGGQ